ncbi:hypothetical protein Tco_0210403 [Tanacetum coccineum]
MIREETPQEEEGVDVTEQIIVNPSFPDQMVTIGGRLSKGCKEQLKTLLKGNMEVFAWEPADMTGVPRKVIEHALNVTLPSIQESELNLKDEGYIGSRTHLKTLKEDAKPQRETSFFKCFWTKISEWVPPFLHSLIKYYRRQNKTNTDGQGRAGGGFSADEETDHVTSIADTTFPGRDAIRIPSGI